MPIPRSRRWRILYWTIGIVAGTVLVAALAVHYLVREQVGGSAEGAHLARIEQSPQWRDGKFRNRRTRVDGPFVETLTQFFFGGSDHRVPSSRVHYVPRTSDDYRVPPPSGLRVTWLGHSTTLVEIDGRRVLIDPFWGRRASPFTFAGPERFYRTPLPDPPPVDAIVISHDHYDHLDMHTVRVMAQRGTRFVVPLGIGAHLRSWDVPDAQITELDWWESTKVSGLMLTATPSRHFSGRWLTDADRALWAGWSIAGPAHRVYYSGDTALDDAMIEIGTRLGPFDLTMIEVGEYDGLWPDVHLGPEQAVRTHRLVRGPAPWWPVVPWRTSAEAPALSTGVSHLMSALPRPR